MCGGVVWGWCRCACDGGSIAGLWLDSVPVLLWEADVADARLTYVAGHVERILGVDAKTWSTISPDDWLHPHDLGAFDVDWDAHVDGEPLEHEVRARRGDGTWVPLDVATWCVHADSPGCIEVVEAVARRFASGPGADGKPLA